jgi:hypothetical protein
MPTSSAACPEPRSTRRSSATRPRESRWACPCIDDRARPGRSPRSSTGPRHHETRTLLTVRVQTGNVWRRPLVLPTSAPTVEPSTPPVGAPSLRRNGRPGAPPRDGAFVFDQRLTRSDASARPRDARASFTPSPCGVRGSCRRVNRGEARRSDPPGDRYRHAPAPAGSECDAAVLAQAPGHRHVFTHLGYACHA